MAIQYPTAGSIFYTQVSSGDASILAGQIASALVSCGWSQSTATTRVSINLTSSPSDGDTVTIGGQTYTFKTVINNANVGEVLISGGAGFCAIHLAEAISGGAGSGTDYSSATTANSTVVVLDDGVNPFVVATVTGGADINASTTSGVITISGGGYKLTMPKTPQGLDAAVWVENVGVINSGNQTVRFRIGTVDASLISGTNDTNNVAAIDNGCLWLEARSGRTVEFCGNAHQFFLFVLGDSSTLLSNVSAGVPWIRPFHTPQAITGATNASPIVITVVGHGFSTGDDVFISQVGGNTAANGFFTITKIDADTFSLNSSTGSGSYTAATGLVASRNQIARAMWLNGDSANAVTWRSGGLGNQPQYWVCLNQYYHGGHNTIGGPSLLVIKNPAGNEGANLTCPNWGEIGDLLEPRLTWAIATAGGQRTIVGQLWASFVVMEAMPMDRLNTGFDGHNWIQYLDGTSSDSPGSPGQTKTSFWLAKA